PVADNNHPDLLRLWALELREAAGEPADALLTEVDHLLRTTSGGRPMLLAVKADLQSRGGDRAGAEATARAALGELNAYRSELDVRAYRGATLERLQKVSSRINDAAMLEAVRLASHDSKPSDS
ncbi:MAG TPA: hypothetical protein VGE86_08930, partial [Thermoanaerobaculia bacterium]